jgi:hypothetical protein
MSVRPTGMLQSRSLVAALRAAGRLPQSITRRLSTPSNYQGHQGHWRVVQTFLAIDPGPAMATLKLPKRRTWPRRLPLGLRAAVTGQPARHNSGIEVGGLTTHGTKVERWSKIPRRCGPWRPRRPVPDESSAALRLNRRTNSSRPRLRYWGESRREARVAQTALMTHGDKRRLNWPA